jgi:DNA-binding PadR family transcriptional regulator
MQRPQPLTPAVFHILLALADGDKHGYAIMQEVDVQTEGRVRMGPGTLYGSLDRLLESRLIEECSGSGERRRYYRLTANGKHALQAEADRLNRAVAHARRKGVLAGKAVRA